MRFCRGTCQNLSHLCCNCILHNEWHYSMSEKNCCQRCKSSSGLGSCSWGENAIPDWLMDRYKPLQWYGPAPVSTCDQIAVVLNIPVNLPCDPDLRPAVGGGCKSTTKYYKYKRLKWAFEKVVELSLRKRSKIQQEPMLLQEQEEADQTSAHGVKGGGGGISSPEETLWHSKDMVDWLQLPSRFGSPCEEKGQWRLPETASSVTQTCIWYIMVFYCWPGWGLIKELSSKDLQLCSSAVQTAICTCPERQCSVQNVPPTEWSSAGSVTSTK